MNKIVIKRMVIMLLLVGTGFAALIGYRIFSAKMMHQYLASQGRPAATVTTMKAVRLPWQPQLRAIGTLRAIQGVSVSAEIAGIVKKIHFHSGDRVKQGDLLVELDSVGDAALLRSLRASRKLAEITLQRDRAQFKIHAVSRSQLDAAQAALTSSKALEAQQQDVVDNKQIRAPFSGQLGIRKINLGQFLTPAEQIVSLQNIHTLFVDFNLPQQHRRRIKVGQSVRVTSNAVSHVVSGKVSAIDTVVNRDTRNLLVEAVVANADGGLLPGMFVHVALNIGAPTQQITLPQTAVSYHAYGSTVFVVRQAKGKEEGGGGEKPASGQVAEQLFVTTGATRGDQIAILSGVAEGDTVVTSGQIKLKNGTPLKVNNAILPTNNPAPTPQEQ